MCLRHGGDKMISEALIITAIGMAGVFLFLLLLICAMHILRICVAEPSGGADDEELAQVAVAITAARRKK